MKKIHLFLINFLLALSIQAQVRCTFSGTVVDENGQAIPFASIYIPALSTGNMANIEGIFQLSMPCNTYNITIQSIGYHSKSFKIDLNNSQEDKKFILNTKIYQNQEITVNSSSEDPAYNIIRKAIVMAQYYKKQVKQYECDIYVRSFYNTDDIPYLAKKLMDEEDLREMKVGNIYETVLHYSYEYPNKIKEKIKHVRTGSQDTSKNGSNFINLSFYNIGGSTIISPLSKNAFSVYEFEFINSYAENGKMVNKIRIKPKRSGNDLMKGHLYINDATWSINTVDVNFKQQFIDLEYKQIYSEVMPNTWLPISHDIKAKTKLLGFKVHFQYLASLSNIQLKTDSIIDKKIQNSLQQNTTDLNLIKEEITKSADKEKLSKTEGKINELIQKENLNKKETLKLVRLIKRQENIEKENVPESLEITGNHETIYDDSAFVQKDSTWNHIRKIPLSIEETNIYVSRDSINLIISGDTIINKERRLLANIFVFNGFLKTRNKDVKIQLPGLFRQLYLNFNTVDGIIINKTLFNYNRKFGKGRHFSIEPRIEFLLARPGMNKELKFVSVYNPIRRSSIEFNVGKVSEDFNHANAILPTINTISSLLFEQNFSKIYQKEYFQLTHLTDLKNGLTFESTLEYENRTHKQNNSSLTFFNRKNRSYSSNQPDHHLQFSNTELFQNHQAFNLSAGLSYTPKYFYKIENGSKRMMNSKYQTFKLNYKTGLKNIFGSDNSYNLLSFSIQHETKYRLINRVSYFIGYGQFIGRKSTYFADFKSFSTTPFFVSGTENNYSFRLLDYYKFNSNKYHLEGHLSIEDNALFLKRLPLLNETSLTEELHFNYLLTEQKKQFYEFGYSLNGILFFLNLETFVSFIDHKHDATGLRISLKF